MINILVTGVNGQLGREIKALKDQFLDYNFLFTNRETLDLSKTETIDQFFENNFFDVIINCAAYTGVDKAESEPKLANLINNLAVEKIAYIAKAKNIKLIHISTDYVFDGNTNKQYNEEDAVSPINVYGKTKLAGEESIKSIAPKNSIIIRTSWVYSSFGNNFLKTMLKLSETQKTVGVVIDQLGSPTFANDLAETILKIIPSIKNDAPVIYHFTNEGVVSWYDFAHAIFDITQKDVQVMPLSTSQFPRPALRPHMSLLNKEKIKSDFNITIPYWRKSLEKCIANLDTLKED